jgi:ribose transport system ATP-binding protein
MNDNDVILEVRRITKEFPGVKALAGVDLTLRRGEIQALVGENGAGKSTLIKILAGVYRKDSGEILFEGAPLELHSAHDSLRKGIKVVFQELALIPQLSVAENVFLESFPLKRGGAIDWRSLNRRTREILDSINLDLNPTRKVSTLTISQQQMVEIARALSHEAKAVIMDEPTSALTPRGAFAVRGDPPPRTWHRRAVRQSQPRRCSSWRPVTVFATGKWISPPQQTNTNAVVTDMVGRAITTLFPRTHAGRGEPVLEVRGLRTEGKLKGVSFRVHAGEVVGFFGLLGAGRSELAKAIFGLDPVSAGEVLLRGRRLRLGSTSQSARAGLGLLTEDRKGEGLVLQMSVAQNMTLPSVREFARLGLIRSKAENLRSQEYVQRLAIKTPSLRHKVEYLSGGNQQKVLWPA